MAIAATMQWDTRTTGSDSNGGGFDPVSGTPGTDYSQQNSPQVAFTDLVIGATNTQLTSSANPFTSAYVGNVINITSGSGFTAGRYQVTSVSGSTATMDQAVGTASSTGGNGNLGGSLLTITAANAVIVASNTVNIQAGTYTVTSSIAVPQATMSYIGYQTTHNDGGTKPLITTATNSVTIFNTGSSNSGVQVFSNLSLSNTAGTRASGIWELSGHGNAQHWAIVNCLFDGFNIAIDSSNGTPDDIAYIHVIGSEIKNSVTAGYSSQSSGTVIYAGIFGCYFHDNAAHIISGSGFLYANKTLFVHSTGPSFGVTLGGGSVNASFDQCTLYNNDASALFPGAGTAAFSVCNCIFYGNTGTALSTSGMPANAVVAAYSTGHSNAFGSNTTNYSTNWLGSPGDVTLTADPFTNAAGGDFSLNTTSGGGAACKGAGYPGVFPGATSTGHVDIGAVQSAGGGGGGGTGGSFAFIS